MADFPSTRSPQRPDLTDAIGREIVVQHEGPVLLPRGIIHALLIGRRAERERNQRLCLSPGKQRRSVRPGEDSHFTGNGPDVRIAAAVDSPLLLQDHFPENLFFQLVQGVIDLGAELGIFHRRAGEDFLPDFLQCRVPRLLHRHDVGLPHFILGLRDDFLPQVRIDLDSLDGLLGLAGSLPDFILYFDHGPDGLQSKAYGLDGGILVYLAGATFHHDQVDIEGTAPRAGEHFSAHHEYINVAVLHLLARGVADILPVDTAHPRAGNGYLEGNARYLQCDGCPQHGGHIGIVFIVQGQYGGDQLRFIAVPVREERPDGPVDDPGSQDFPLVGSSFPFEKTAGNLSRRKCHLLVVHGQRHEVQPFPAALRRHHGDEDHRVSVCDEHTAVGLAGHIVDLQENLPPRKGCFKYLIHSACTSS